MAKKLLLLSPIAFGLLFIALAGEESIDVSAQLKQAENYKNDGDYEQAEEIYQQIVTDNPGTDYAFQARKNLVLLYIATDSRQQADAAFQELLTEFSAHEGVAEAINQIASNYGMKLKKYNRARELYQYVLDHYPDGEHAMWAQRGLAFADIHTGDYAAAEVAIEELLANFPDHEGLAKAFNWLGNDYRRVGEYQRARELYQYVLDNWPGAEDAIWAQQGVIITSIQVGDDQTTEAAFGSLLSDFSGHEHIAKAVNKIAGYYDQSKKYEIAREVYLYVADNWPQSKQAIWSQKRAAILSIQLGDEVAAESAIEKLLTEFSGDDRIATVITGMANEYQKNFKKHDGAINLYQHVLENWPDAECAIWAQKGLLVSHSFLGDELAAEAAIEKLLADFSEDKRIASVVAAVADNYSQLSRYDKARTYHQYVADTWPQSKQAIWSQKRAVILSIQLGDEVAAESAIEKLLTEFSGHKHTAKVIYQVARETKDDEKARVLYQHIVNNHPDSQFAILSQANIANINTQFGDEMAAQAILDALLVDFSTDPILPRAVAVVADGYYEVAIRKEKEGLDEQTEWYYRKAIAECERIVNELPDTPYITAEACYFSGFCYSRLGEHKKSIEYYQKVVDNWPDYEYAWYALFRIGRNYEELKKSGLMSESEADQMTRAVYEQLLEEHPACKVATHARHWLSRHN